MKSLLRYSLLVATFLTLPIFTMAQMTVDVTVDQHVSCPSGDDGKLTIVVSNGIAEPMSVLVWNTTLGVYDFIPIVGPSATLVLPDDGALPVKGGSFIVFVSGPSASASALPFEVFEPEDISIIPTQPTCAVPTGAIEIAAPVETKGGTYTFNYSVDGGTNYQPSPLFNGLSAGDYSIEVEISSHTQCYLTDMVTINSPPTPPDEPTFDVTQPTCAVPTGTVVVSSPIGPDLEYAINVGGPWQDAVTFSGLPDDNIYTIFVQRKSDNTCQNSKGVMINPAPVTPPAPTVTVTDATCLVGGEIEVTDPLGAEYEYSIDGTNYQAGTTFSDVAPGTYSVTVRPVVDPLCVSVPTTATVNAGAGAPEIDNVSHTHPTSAGGSDGTITVNLKSGEGTPDYIYHLTDNLGNSIANSVPTSAITYQFTGLSAGNYTVYVTDAIPCVSASVTDIILVDPVSCTDAVITLTSGSDDQNVCKNEDIESIVYTITGDFSDVSVVGLPTGVTGSLSATTYTISGTPSESGTFSYTITVAGFATCSGDVASGTIVVNEPISPEFDPLGTYCRGDAAAPLPTTSKNGITGSWTPTTISTDNAGVTTYNFTPADGQCDLAVSMSVTVYEAPQNVDAGPDVTICEGESTQLQGSVDLPINNNVLFNEDFSSVASGGLPAGWARNSSLWGGMNTNLAGGSAPEMAIFTDGSTDIQTYRVYTPLINAADNQFLELSFKHELIHYNGPYTVEVQTSPDGVNWTSCWSEVSSGTEGSHIPAQTVSIDLSTLDGESFYVAFTYTGALFNIDYWNFDDVKLTGLQSDPVDILWTPSTGLSDPTILKPIASPLVTTTYTLTVGIGGCENSDQVTVTVKEIVAPVFSLNPTYEYCIGDSPVILPLVSDNGIEGTWDPSTISTDVSGLTTYTFTPNPGECATPTSIDVQVFDLPTAHMSGGGEYCEGADPTGVDVQIDFTGVAPWTYTFAVSGDVRTFTSSDNPKIFDNRGEGYFELLSVQDANCTGTVSGDALVVEIPAPTATISGGGVYCEGVLATGVDVSIDLTGTGPWDIIYAIDGTDQPTVTGVTSSPYVIANATAGVYTLTSVNDSSPCLGTVSGSATVTELESPTATISGGGGYCAGTTPTGVDVTITLTGNAPWDVVYAIDGANQAAVTGITSSPYVITNAAVGEYTLTSVGDINGCDGTVSGSATVTEWELPTATISGGGGYCAGVDPTGVNVNIELTGVGPWNIVYAIDGVSQPTVTGVNSSPYVITNATEGVYTLISVGDSSPCPGTVSGSATVIEFELPTATISGGGDYCAGANPTGVDVTITLTGNGPWNIVYAIDGADQLAVTANSSPYTLSNVTAGEYTLTSVDDINGCIGTVSGLATVVERELPTATMSGGGSYCKGADPTGVDVRIDFTGQAPWTYTFAVGGEERTFIATETPRIFENRGEGHFTIISVEDAYCTGTVSGEAFVYEIVTAPPTGDSPQEFCAGATLADIVVAGEAIAWYDAPDGNVLNLADLLVDGQTYYATQTAEGCESTDYLAVTVNVWNELSINVVDVNHGRCDIPDAGSIEVQGVGNAFPYTYTLFDEFNSQVGSPIVSDNPSSVLFANLVPGRYYITFTDISPCVAETNLIEILEAVPVTIDDVLITNSHCFGDDNATVEITASGGGANLYFSLLDNFNTPIIGPQINNGVLLGVPDGEYTILVVGENACEATLPIIISGPDQLTVQTDIVNLPCSYSGNVGIIRALAFGGTAPYTVSLYLDGTMIEQETGLGYNSWVEFDGLLPSSNYEVEVDDRWGCGPVLSGMLEVTSPTELIVGSPNVQDVLCYGDSSGQISISASGGTAPYAFTLFDNNYNMVVTSTNGVFENIPFGINYSISVVDDNACGPVYSANFNVNQPDPIVIDINSIVVTPISYFGADDGEISLVASGGTGNLYYTLIKDGIAIAGPQVGNGTFTGLGSGTYIVEVTDDRDCGPTLSDVINIDEPPILSLELTGTDVSCYGLCDGTITVRDDYGLFTLDKRQWFNEGGEDISDEINGKYDVVDGVHKDICPGIYTLVIDINGEVQTEDVVISEPDPMIITSLNIYHLNCYGDNKGEIAIWAEGNTPTLEYRIEGPVDSANNIGLFSNMPAGVYDLFITDENNCSHIFTEGNRFEIEQPDSIVISTDSKITERICHYDTTGIEGDGIVEMVVAGGTPDYTYMWSKKVLPNGDYIPMWNSEQQSKNLEYPTPGNYKLTVTDRNNCVAFDTVEVPGPPPIDITFAYDTADCRVADTTNSHKPNGGVNILNITGGNADGDYEIRWYSGSDDEHLANFDGSLHLKDQQANNYYVVIIDTMGCAQRNDFTIPVDESNFFDVSIGMDKENYCYNDQAYLTAESAISPDLLKYRWVNVTDSPDVEHERETNVYTTGVLLYNTTFRVNAISSKGCIETSDTTLSVYPRIGPYIDRDTHPFFMASDLNTFFIETDEGEVSDTSVISLLADTEYTIEVSTEESEIALKYSWLPNTCFNPDTEKQATMIFKTGEYQNLLTDEIFNIITQKEEQYIPIKSIVISEHGCKDSVMLKARILDKIKNSNVFSPNGDGINDRWKIPYSDVMPNLEVQVFNRWGALVWSAKGSEAARGWDGKNRRGKDLSIGTYYYIISFNIEGTQKWKPISGSVTIIR
ncbi:MAG: gliding motility-associated C-terminal domain-containing protein [Bacteroidales bacterium]|nr:gliding motility-associated C-terminal domain-containing protein [Bacteroidales bacterium]